MIFYSYLLPLALLRLPGVTARQFTVVNSCSYTVWHVPIDLVILSRRLPRRSDLSLTVIQACSGCPPAIPASHCFLNLLFRSSPTLTSHRMCRNMQRGASDIFSFWRSHSCIYRWEAAPSTSVSFTVPDNWKAGRIWVRIFSFFPQLPVRRYLAAFSR